MRVTSFSGLQKIKSRGLKSLFPPRTRIAVGLGSCGIAAGADSVFNALKEEAAKRLTEAIKVFEKKFKRRYTPLVNEHLDFGLWGLRAHYRLSRTGPRLETMYSRIFQLGFTPEGIGYLGSDNISNKQTGDLEILRLGPVNEIMVASIGGEEALLARSLKAPRPWRPYPALFPKKRRTAFP